MKLFYKLFAVSVSLLFLNSCEKMGYDNMTFSNMSGVDFYDCKMYFSNSEDGALIDYEDAGNVMMGASTSVKKLGDYCYIYAKDYRGGVVMSKKERAYDGMTISKYDLY